MNRLISISMCVLILVLVSAQPSHADIYMKRGPYGTMHFSNCPMGTDWTLYAKETKRQKKYTPYTTQRKFSRAQFDSLIAAIARNQGMNPSVIKGIIEVESGYNPYARSSKGAMGLMQLMPQTAQDLGVSDPWDPTENITAGTKYISWLLRKYNGNLSLALAAYNAGPAAVDSFGGIPPYQETTEYVKNVLARIYGGGYAAQ